MKSVAFSALAVAFVVVFLFPRNAYAYIDPGTGSYLFQVVLSIFFASAFAVRLTWRRFMRFFANLFTAREPLRKRIR